MFGYTKCIRMHQNATILYALLEASQRHLIPVRHQSPQMEYFTINTWFNFIRTNAGQTGNKATKQSTTEYVVRCRMMSYAPRRLAVSLKLSFLLQHSSHEMKVGGCCFPPSAASKTVQSYENSSDSKKLTHAVQKERLQCNPPPVLHNGLHTWPRRGSSEKVSAGLRLPCASGCRRLRAEDPQKSANCLG